MQIIYFQKINNFLKTMQTKVLMKLKSIIACGIESAITFSGFLSGWLELELLSQYQGILYRKKKWKTERLCKTEKSPSSLDAMTTSNHF